MTALRLDNIQGNILAGFNKDHQAFLFINFPAGSDPKGWLKAMTPDIATTVEVRAFNELFKEINSRRDGAEGTIKSTWLNLAISAAGLTALGVPANEVESFPEAFRAGMRARTADIGDVGPSDPSHWLQPFGSTDVHAVVLVASDDRADLDAAVLRQIDLLTDHDVRLVFTQDGRARTDLPGHEHFGFKDGVSQPGVRGFTPEGANANQGVPGQDLLWPGEFVLGYPKQQPHPTPTPIPGPPSYGQSQGESIPPVSKSEPITEAGSVAASGPAWTVDGSFLVFRRLQQDVAAFDKFLSETAQSEGITESLLGAKLVGRYKSGCPLEHTPDEAAGVDPQAFDPSGADPSLLTDDKINNFEYGADEDGSVVPRATHIRKVYPRDEATPGGGEADTQTHRLLRRGIAYGEPYDPGAPTGSRHAGDATFPHDRGLLFLCYQTSLEEQFEFVQSRWVNSPVFPQPGDGQDPIIAQEAPERSFNAPTLKTPGLTLPQFVTTTGGEYFFSPSISALESLSQA
jgi:Dyp-type peroxidase family